MKKMNNISPVNWLDLHLLGIISFDSEELRIKYKSVIQQAKIMENENLYTKEDFLKAAEAGEVSMIDAKHIVSLLDEVKNK